MQLSSEAPFGLPQVRGNTCYYNAALQAFSAAFLCLGNYPLEKDFIGSTYKLLTEKSNARNNSEHLLSRMQNHKNFSTFQIGSMDDSFLFLRSLVTTYQDESKEFFNNFTINREIETKVSCCEMEFYSKLYPPMYYVRNESNVQEQMTNLVKSAQICPKCKKEFNCQITLPNVLLISTPKEKRHIQINSELKIDNENYRLVGISGSYGAHAVAYTLRGGRWFLCNDSSVTLVENNKIEKNGFFDLNLLPLGLVYLHQSHFPQDRTMVEKKNKEKTNIEEKRITYLIDKVGEIENKVDAVYSCLETLRSEFEEGRKCKVEKNGKLDELIEETKTNQKQTQQFVEGIDKNLSEVVEKLQQTIKEQKQIKSSTKIPKRSRTSSTFWLAAAFFIGYALASRK